MNQKKIIPLIIAGVIILFILVSASVTTVGAGERGVLLKWGAVQDEILNEGLHFKLPVRDVIKKVNVQIQKEESNADAASKDLQSVSTDIAVNYRPKIENVNTLYQNVGIQYGERIVSPAIQEMVKATISQYTAEELITKRSEVKETLKNLLKERLDEYNIALEDISITNFSFSQEFDRSIEEKQTAVQNALRAENDLRRIEIEAKQKIEQAKAEAEQIKIQSQAIKEQGGAEYLQLKYIEKWNGELPKTILGENTNPIIDIKQP